MRVHGYYRYICIIVAMMFTGWAMGQSIDPLLSSVVSKNQTMKEQAMKAKPMGKVKAFIPSTIIKSDGTKEVFGGKNIVNGIDTMIMKERMVLSYNADGSIKWLSVIGQLNDGEQCPTKELNALGIEVMNQFGNAVCMKVPIETWGGLSQMTVFASLDADHVYKVNNNLARNATKVTYITGEKKSTIAPPTKYTGKGVIAGVIDIGIDFNHASFRHPVTGETRIKKALVFTGYYGSYNETDSANIGTLTTGTYNQMHGTHTSATVAGSRVPGFEHNAGMAHEADLILCDLPSLTDQNIMAAEKFIYDYSVKTGKPAVINQSFGGHSFPFNGATSYTKYIGDLTKQGTKAGFVVCNSAGNEGDEKMGFAKRLDKSRTFKTCVNTDYVTTVGGKTVPAYTSAYFYIYNTKNKGFYVKYKAVDINTGEEFSLDSIHGLYNSSGNLVNIPDSVHSSKRKSGDITYQYSFTDEDNVFFIQPDLRLAVFVYGDEGTEGEEFIIRECNASPYSTFVGSTTYPALIGYTEGNGEVSISSGCCTDNVISVGAWTSRKYWTPYSNPEYSYYVPDLNENTICNFSSYGKDDNGISRPDIIAPGAMINSAVNLYDYSYFDKSGNVSSAKNAYLTEFGAVTIGGYNRNNGFAVNCGTSMSCPVTTGIVALMLQADSTLTTHDVRRILKETATNDQYTTDITKIPSGNRIQAGAGKINALAAINKIVGNDVYDLVVETTKKQKVGGNVQEIEDKNISIAVSNDNGQTWYYDNDTIFNGMYTEMKLSKAGSLSALVYATNDSLLVKKVTTTADKYYCNYEISFMTADAEDYSDCRRIKTETRSRLKALQYGNGALFFENIYALQITEAEEGWLKITENRIPQTININKSSTASYTLKADNNTCSGTAYPEQVISIAATGISDNNQINVTQKQTIDSKEYDVEVAHTISGTSSKTIAFTMPENDVTAKLNTSTTSLTKLIPTEAEEAMNAVSKLEAGTSSAIILNNTSTMSFQNIEPVFDELDASAYTNSYDGSASVTVVNVPKTLETTIKMRLGYRMKVLPGVKYTTYFAPEALKLTGTGITVYKAEYNTKAKELNLVSIGEKGDGYVIIPGNTPCMIEAPENTQFLMLGGQASSAAPDTSDIKGTLVSKTCTQLMAENEGCTIFVLNKVDDTVGFFRLKNKADDGVEGTLGPNRAYLAIPSTKAKGDDFIFWNNPTGIEEVNFSASNAQDTYNLQGMRVNESYKGIIVKNGKKFLAQ